jgi:hypothetical protein
MMVGVEPAVVGVAEARERADVDHEAKVAKGVAPSSVTAVTGGDKRARAFDERACETAAEAYRHCPCCSKG